jgi:tRNA wybutosine-synthesizing protein 2
MDTPYISLCVPRHLVKKVKTKLEGQGKLSNDLKITPLNSAQANQQGYMIIPTTMTTNGPSQVSNDDQEHSILAALELGEFIDKIRSIVEYRNDKSGLLSTVEVNPLTKAVKLGLESMPSELYRETSLNVHLLLSQLPMTYSLYPPLLLLPKHIFSAQAWIEFLAVATKEQVQRFYQSIATSMNVTHIATNAPIPRMGEINERDQLETQENVLRSPTHLKLLYGDFHQFISSTKPTTEEFNFAFWVSTRQNGIIQVWAPLYTMFSRGNITEKARVLDLPSVKEAVKQGEEDGKGCAAVDLYAGIGYFAFSYAKAGMNKIYCWELNPWSVEGFKRGAEKNKWGVHMIESEEADEGVFIEDTAKFVVFKENNAKAGSMIENLRASIPPIRQVNCGLLPTSKGSWETAVQILDPELGGWIHLHENIATLSIQSKAQQILEQIQRFVINTSGEQKKGADRRTATLEHVEQVKTYAPGVMHCVLDIYISS